ncbi:MAG: hypothetical protein EPO42_14385 [Gallionellaceae bacterium]|nr:MAG: hypothetical protein EPO42_14385 [Gallionellaceae bacterium]
MPLTLADKVVKLLPDVGRLGVNPFDAGDDWLEQLDKNDRPGVILMLSAPSTDVSPREIARAVSTLKADWFIDYDDSDASRVALAAVGPIYKVHDAPDRLFCSSFTPAAPELVEWVQPPRMPTRKALKTVQFQGLTVKIDRPKGFVQKGKDDDGNEWSRTYELDYGFIPRTKGGDGEELDVFMGPSGDSSRAFWVTQQKADGSFDEYKLFLGFDSPRDARLAYAAHIPEKFYAGMTEMSVEQLKALLNLEPTVELLKTLVRPTVGFDAPTDAVLRAFDRHMSKVVKAGTAGDERYVLGIVLEPDVVDAQNDTYSAEEVRAAEHVFMEEYRNLGFMHKQMVTGDVKILESYIAPVDFAMGDINVKKGTWLMAVRVLDDGLWRQVKSGGLTGFSIGGSAVRKPA